MKKITFAKIGIIFFSICFMLPSVIYLLKNKTVLNFGIEYYFLLTENINRIYQAGIFAILLLGFIACYYLIIKNSGKIFKNIKQVYCLILLISFIFVWVLPFWSSDIFYYLGIGRLASTYNQNPYYVDIQSYVDDNSIDIQNDEVIEKGYTNYWSNTTVVYGPVWTLICSGVSFLSLGNINFGLLIFKIINLLVHMGNCYLLYKISKKRIFPLLYGLNPFILIEGIANVHNDIFVIFFILLSLYMLLKKRNIILSILFLALSTNIKYFAILLLPFIIIYHYRNENIKTRIIKCIEYGILFLVFVLLPYLIYMRDTSIFIGMFAQQNKIAKSVYLLFFEYFKNPPNLVSIIKNASLCVFAIIYVVECILLLCKKDIKFYKEMRKVFLFILAFTFLLITNFQPWYLIWLTPFMIWQKSENIKLITQMQIMSLIANIVFLAYSEYYKYGIPFFVILVSGTLACMIDNKSQKRSHKNKIRKEI